MCSRQGRALPSAAGFTIVEILVALGLTGLLTVALLAVAQVHSAMQRREQEAQQTQDNVRAALEEMVNNTRAAGRAFLAGVATNAVPNNMPAQVTAVTVVNDSLATGTGDSPDVLQLVLSDDSKPVATLAQPALMASNPLVVNSAGALRQNDFALLTNFYYAVLYRLTADPTMGVVPGTQFLPVTPPTTPPPVPFLPGALVVPARLISYRIDPTVFAGTPVLTLQDGAPLDLTATPQLVAENIEDLQVALGIDGLHDGAPNGVIQELGQAVDDDEWVYNFAGETLPNPLPPNARLAAVRITVVGRTAQTIEMTGSGRPAVEDRPAGPADGYRWRVLTALVALRSMVTN